MTHQTRKMTTTTATAAAAVYFLLTFHTATHALVQKPPLITKQPPTDELLFQVAQRQDENDKPFLIECEAEGEPAPKYRWMKNGKEFNWQTYDNRISQQPGRGTLVVTSPKTEDIGQYQCFATNVYGTATSNSVFVRKAELNAFKEENPTTIIAEEGDPFKLGCSPPDGWPKPQVYWMLQKSTGALKSINSSRITVDPEGSLWFSNVTREDKSSEFLYSCVAYSPFRNEYKLGNRVYFGVTPTSSSATQNKRPPVMQYATKRNTVAIRGQSVSLWCIVGGTPLPEIKWAKKGSQLPNEVEYDNYGKTLRIKNVDFDAEGNYDCDASNGVGSPISYSVHLTVYAVPYFKIEPEIQNAAEGETIEFQCAADGKPAPEIKWIHNGLPLDQAEANPRRKIIGNRIVIENIKKDDTGNYGCNATNSFGYVYKDVYVNVLALPAEILEKPTNVITTDGKDVTLQCRVFGAPKPLVRWLRNNQELTGGRFQVLDNGDLNIERVSFVDAGEYICDARNKFGNDSAGGTLVVKEHTRIVDNPEDYEVAAGTTATFRCSAVTDSTLNLEIDWLRNGQQIDFDAEQRYVKLQDNSLTIDKTTEIDSGVYTCQARTEYDSATANATLIVQDVPNRPELLDIECRKRDSTIRWKPMGDNRSPILHYTIQYNTSFTPDTWEIASKDVPATETAYTVSMSPWANYTFRVIARNKIGPSQPSLHSEVCTTTTDVPYKNPENVKGHGNSPTNLLISWTPMQEIDHNAPKFKYQVQWKPEDENDGTGRPPSEWQLEEIRDWTRSEIIIENQPTYRPYKIRVRAINEVGESNVAPTEITGFSGQAEPTEAPGNFTMLQKIDARTAIVAWDPVRPESLRGKFEGYKVQTWTDNDNDDDRREIMIKNDATSAVVAKLIPFSKNYLVVMAYNTDHNGPPSRVIEVVTDQGVPGPVDDFQGYSLGSSALYLMWRKPAQPNGILKGYRIYYQRVELTEVGILMERTPAIMDPEVLKAKLAGLEPGTKYRVHIRAETEPGIGDDTFIEVSTEPQGLQTPLDQPRFRWTLEPRDNGRAAVKVFWVPSLTGNGRPGSHFYVQYKLYGQTSFESTEPELYEDFITVRGLDPGTPYVFRVVAVDGELSRHSEAEEILTNPSDGLTVVQAKPASSSSAWFIGLIVAIAFLLLILILVCIVKRNRGGKYAVYEREIAHGRLDYDEGGFREYSQPTDGSGGAGPAPEFKPPHESDTDSMAEYGGEDGKFTEDGSFIGQYGVKRKPSTLPSPVATFV